MISGVHRPTTQRISAFLPDSQSLMGRCVDLDRSAVNTRSNAAETRRWAPRARFKSLIVVTVEYHIAACHRGTVARDADIDLIPSRGRRKMAR